MQRSYHFAAAARTALDAGEIDRLRAAGRVRHFDKGQIIQHQGDAGQLIWAVIEGHVSISRFSEDGGQTVFAVVGAGDLFGELAFFTGIPRQVSAIATGPAALVPIDRALLRQLMLDDVGWAELLLRSLSRQLAVALDIIDRERRLPMADRIYHLLADMRADRGDDRVRVTQQQLADLLGVSRVTAAAALAALERAGRIERGYGWIRLKAKMVSNDTGSC